MNNGEEMNVKSKDIYTEHKVPVSGKPSVPLGFFAPEWLKQDQKVTLLHQDVYRQGYLLIGKENLWNFLVRDQDRNNVVTVPIANIAYSWKHRLQENTFELGWQDNIARHVGGIGRHVSAELLRDPLTPSNLKKD